MCTFILWVTVTDRRWIREGKGASRGVQDAGVPQGVVVHWEPLLLHGSGYRLLNASRRSRHRADSTFTCGNHPPPLTIPKPSPGRAGEAHGIIQFQVLAATLPPKAQFGSVCPTNPGGRRDLRGQGPRPRSRGVPWMLSLSATPRHAPSEGQTLKGDKALGQVLQAGLTGSAPAIKNPEQIKEGVGCCCPSFSTAAGTN